MTSLPAQHCLLQVKKKKLRNNDEARHHLLQPKKNQHQGFVSWVVEDNDKPEGSSSFSQFFCFFFSGGRPEASKRNLNFQSATWHHLKHLQSKDFFHSP